MAQQFNTITRDDIKKNNRVRIFKALPETPIVRRTICLSFTRKKAENGIAIL